MLAVLDFRCILAARKVVLRRRVPKGKVRILRAGEPTWIQQKRRYDTNDEEVAEGEADQDGLFLAHLDLSGQQKDLRHQERDRF